MRWSWGFWRRERDRARATLSMTDLHEPRLARSWREASSWVRSLREPNWSLNGSVESVMVSRSGGVRFSGDRVCESGESELIFLTRRRFRGRRRMGL